MLLVWLPEPGAMSVSVEFVVFVSSYYSLHSWGTKQLSIIPCVFVSSSEVSKFRLYHATELLP